MRPLSEIQIIAFLPFISLRLKIMCSTEQAGKPQIKILAEKEC